MSLTQSRGSTQGRTLGSESIVNVEYDAAILAVDDLIRPPATVPYIAPGFIDLQVNGFAGVDYNDPACSAEDFGRSLRQMFSTGVTRMFPTVITSSKERMTQTLANLSAIKEELTRDKLNVGGAIAGFHLEGPYISPESGPRGVHPLKYIRPPDFDEFQRLQEAARGQIRLVTLSPEWDGAAAFTNLLLRSGVVVSVGHTKASPEQIKDVVDAGATMCTHIGNAGHPMLPKIHNYIWEQLAEDRLTASFIADGYHLPSSFLKVALRAKGCERSILISDAVMPAMCAPGTYRLGDVDVELREDGRVVLLGGTRLAGSTLRMDAAVANAVRLAGVSLRDAVTMASINPARVTRVAGRQRGIATGEKADLVRFIWDDNAKSLQVVETIVSGETVFQDVPSTGDAELSPQIGARA